MTRLEGRQTLIRDIEQAQADGPGWKQPARWPELMREPFSAGEAAAARHAPTADRTRSGRRPCMR